jgi:hypothetical protein
MLASPLLDSGLSKYSCLYYADVMDYSMEMMRPLGPEQQYHWLEEALS